MPPYIPRVFCGCGKAMVPYKNGVSLLAMTENNKPYYKVQADQYQCRSCGTQVFTGFGEPVEHFQEAFPLITHDRIVQL